MINYIYDNHSFRSNHFVYLFYFLIYVCCIIILKLCNPFKLVTKLLMIMLNYLLSFIEGRMHDARILGESGLIHDLEQVAFAPDGTPLCLYGDPAYPLRLHLQQPIRNPVNEVMRLYNKEMISVRVSVEWLFGEITKYFKFVDFKQQLKLRLSLVGKLYIVCAILQNSLACLYGNIVSDYFELDPPTLGDYFWTV